VLFTLAFLALQDLAVKLPPQEVLQANRILQYTCLKLTQGQYLDISYEAKPTLPMESYWPMVAGKTSALLSCSCELGALAAEASEEQRARFREFGRSLGLAFQVLDDWLGIWGDTLMTGKSAESDLVSGKKTLPVLYAIAKDGLFARRWMQGSIKPDEVPALARLLEEEGARSHTLDVASRLTDQAMQSLREAVIDQDAGLALVQLADALLQRKN
jgi:geranylgeranyl diphosphate synthase type I